jgi:benzoylformate decarboxylase
MGAIFNAQANKSPLLVTAGQQARHADHDAGEPDQPRRGRGAAPAREVELRAAARRGRAGALAQAIHWGVTAAEGPGVRLDPDGRLGRRGRRGRRRLGDAAQHVTAAHYRTRTLRELAQRSTRPSNPVFVAGPDIDAGGAWDDAIAFAEKTHMPVWAPPPTGGNRLGFPEGHAALPRRAAARDRADRRDARGSRPDRSSRSARRSSPTTRTSRARCCRRVRRSCNHERPDEAARAPMGDAIVADVR